MKLQGFKEICGNDECVCKGYPDPNVRESLLKGPVTLQACANACERSKLCFGFEYWRSMKKYENCFKCPNDPSKRSTIAAINLSQMRDHGKRTASSWGTVYIKEMNDDIMEPGKTDISD